MDEFPNKEAFATIVAQARTSIEKDGRLRATALIDIGKQGLVVDLASFGTTADEAMQMVRAMCRMMEAQAVVIVMEAAMLVDDDVDKYSAAVMSGKMRVSDVAHAKRSVVFTYTDQTQIMWSCAVEIIEQDGKKTFGEVEMERVKTMEGDLFRDLIPKPKSDS